MELTHFDNDGNARMVDVTEKNDTVRTAVATGTIQVNEAVYEAVTAGTVKKGDCTFGCGNGWHYGGEEYVAADTDVPYSAVKRM
ncbi:Cyclic pyranopterin monophosphate synthase [Eubacterium plexicaudatum ASF492]|uniref:Molybdenum cofactor biosynthesis protein C n=1 Tax=Eubacterium plexicaudatum ASF492 TaxID=1235802 RepID=N2A9H6_9FIRM|nr:Cyclic pyranopterin monophosphate synthase [Eubacterium plexicaudatum ASF492]